MNILPLFLLISLIDLKESAVPAQILTNLHLRRYLIHPPDQNAFDAALTALLADGHLTKNDDSLIEVEYSAYGHIQELCTAVSPTGITASGWTRLKEVESYAAQLFIDEETWQQQLAQEKEADNKRIEQEHLQEAELARLHGYPYDILLQARETKRGRYKIYVVLLADSVRQKRGLSIGSDPTLPSVYVGLTGLSVQKRFQNHKANRKAGRGYVRDHGICLLPDLYQAYNPMPHKLAIQAEPALAAKLKLFGYTVLGGH